MPRKNFRKIQQRRNNPRARRYGWTFRGLSEAARRKMIAGAYAAGQIPGYAKRTVGWAGRKIYENPFGTAAAVGAGALGAVAAPYLGAAYLASPALSIALPVAKHFVARYSPLPSSRFTRGLNAGTDAFLSAVSLANAGWVPSAALHAGSLALSGVRTYRGTKRL